MNRIYLKDILTEALGEGYVLEERIYGGMMNISYIVKDKKGKRYVVYLPNGKANKSVNRILEKEISEIIEDLGLTSRFVYFDTKRGIKIKEYIAGKSLDKADTFDYQKVADLLHLLHDSKKLASEDYHPFDRLAIYENRAISFKKESNDYRALKDFLSSNIKLLDNQEKVLSHNDFQKSNIIKSDDDKYYVIDFEFAANNDEMYDIACFANGTVEEGEELLRYYYKNPTKEQYKRFYLWRIFISLQWHNVAIAKHYQKEGRETGFNFLWVADFFINIAKKAQEKFLSLN